MIANFLYFIIGAVITDTVIPALGSLAGIGIDAAASTGAQLIVAAPTVLATAAYTGAVIVSSLVIIGTVTVSSAFAALRAVAESIIVSTTIGAVGSVAAGTVAKAVQSVNKKKQFS